MTICLTAMACQLIPSNWQFSPTRGVIYFFWYMRRCWFDKYISKKFTDTLFSLHNEQIIGDSSSRSGWISYYYFQIIFCTVFGLPRQNNCILGGILIWQRIIFRFIHSKIWQIFIVKIWVFWFHVNTRYQNIITNSGLNCRSLNLDI